MKNRITLLSRRRRGGGAAEWTPSSVSSLAHWYDLSTTGGGYDRSYFQGASDITFDHCALFGAAFAYNIPGTTPGGYDWILQIDMADRVHLVDCLIAYSSNSHIGVYASTGTTLRQNLFCFNRHDNFKFDAPTVDLLLDRNWFSRHVARRWLGTEYTHVDFCQDPNSPVTTTNFRGIGNVMWAGDPTVGGVGASQQGFFLKNSNLVGGYVEQNIIATVGRNVLRNENATNGFYARYNDLLRNEVGGSGVSQTGDNPGITGITSTYHVIATHNLGGWATAGSEVVDLNAQPPDDFSDYNGSGLYTDHPKGYSRDFNWARPPNASARTHWDNANPVGAFARKKEIFVDGRHPGNEGWPVAAQWTHDFNSAGNIASGFTGSLTANGDNV